MRSVATVWCEQTEGMTRESGGKPSSALTSPLSQWLERSVGHRMEDRDKVKPLKLQRTHAEVIGVREP